MGDHIAAQGRANRLSGDRKKVFARMNEFEKVQVGKLIEQQIISLYKFGWLNSTERANAANTLGVLKAETAVQPLIQALGKETDASAQHEMLLALGKIGDCSAVVVLIGYIHNQDIILRKTAAIALGMIGNEQACEDLSRALEDENKDVRDAARAALDEIVKRRAVTSIV